MTHFRLKTIAFLAALFFCGLLPAQQGKLNAFLEPADTFNRARFWMATGTGVTLYTAASIGLWHAWYKNYELGGFRTFDDSGEWYRMDKWGHMFAANMQSWLIFNTARWVGMDRRASMWTGAGGAMLLQTTIEVMDGFSAKWGFSWYDMAFNTLGAGLFVGQELLWEEQRIWMKVSNTRPDYSTAPLYSIDGQATTTLHARAVELYGATFAEAFLKDYNGQTIWFSVNPAAFLLPHRPDSKFPRWLNLAFGIGAQNMYGGHHNNWSDEEGNRFRYDDPAHPRMRQFYLSLDVDLTRIPTRSRILKVLFGALNWIKIPAPTIEFNGDGTVKAYPFYW